MYYREKYTIPSIEKANEFDLFHGIYLIVLNANKIPPHLLISINGKLFTLTIKGSIIDADLKPLVELIKRKRMQTLFIRLSMPVVFTLEELKNEIRKYTLEFPRVDVDIATCLSPIKKFCSSVYNTNAQHVNYLFELLPVLYQKKLIDSCSHLNLDEYMQNNSFLLNKYSMFDIHEEIRKAKTEVALIL